MLRVARATRYEILTRTSAKLVDDELTHP